MLCLLHATAYMYKTKSCLFQSQLPRRPTPHTRSTPQLLTPLPPLPRNCSSYHAASNAIFLLAPSLLNLRNRGNPPSGNANDSLVPRSRAMLWTWILCKSLRNPGTGSVSRMLVLGNLCGVSSALDWEGQRHGGDAIGYSPTDPLGKALVIGGGYWVARTTDIYDTTSLGAIGFAYVHNVVDHPISFRLDSVSVLGSTPWGTSPDRTAERIASMRWANVREALGPPRTLDLNLASLVP
ncbi:hypothetical protein B0H19DRAFT_1366390 [Mycena capillaripes]|nr:hypothetical protein B0H19DRAFT_1366390 [Mycena capillaripes]